MFQSLTINVLHLSLGIQTAVAFHQHLPFSLSCRIADSVITCKIVELSVKLSQLSLLIRSLPEATTGFARLNSLKHKFGPATTV